MAGGLGSQPFKNRDAGEPVAADVSPLEWKGREFAILSAGTCARGAAVSWDAALSFSGTVAKVPAMAETCALCGGQLAECVAGLDRRRQVHG